MMILGPGGGRTTSVSSSPSWIGAGLNKANNQPNILILKVSVYININKSINIYMKKIEEGDKFFFFNFLFSFEVGKRY
jgi:hypothetical protein